jgi:diguanylate cyclase
MFKVFSDSASFNHLLLSKSEFGLWFIHKAAYAFSGTDQVQIIIDRIYEVDKLNLAVLESQDKANAIALIQRIREKIVKYSIWLISYFRFPSISARVMIL